MLTTVSTYQYNYFAEFLSRKIRIDYFRSCLAKDAAFFDENNPTELPSKISSETEKIKSGMGDKVDLAVKAIGTTFAGFIVAFIMEWRLTLLLIVFSPCFLIIGLFIRSIMVGGLTEVSKAYAQSAGYAEQALQAIKVVQAYGQE